MKVTTQSIQKSQRHSKRVDCTYLTFAPGPGIGNMIIIVAAQCITALICQWNNLVTREVQGIRNPDHRNRGCPSHDVRSHVNVV
jgi:hypothetical protein